MRPHQPSDLTLTKLIVFPIWRRKPEELKPEAAIGVQVMGNFVPEIFQDAMFSDVTSVCLIRLGGPNSFAQGYKLKPIVFAVVVTTVQTMSHPVRSLYPPPGQILHWSVSAKLPLGFLLLGPANCKHSPKICKPFTFHDGLRRVKKVYKELIEINKLPLVYTKCATGCVAQWS